MNSRRSKMRAIPWIAAAAWCGTMPFAASAVDFAVPVEAAGISAAVKSIRVVCMVLAPEGMTIGHGFQFVAVAAGGVINQTVTVKLDAPLGKVKANAPYQCSADRAFDVDVTKMNPVPGKYMHMPGHISEGMAMKDINLQANSVLQVGGKL